MHLQEGALAAHLATAKMVVLFIESPPDRNLGLYFKLLGSIIEARRGNREFSSWSDVVLYK